MARRLRSTALRRGFAQTLPLSLFRSQWMAPEYSVLQLAVLSADSNSAGRFTAVIVNTSASGRMPAVKRRTLLQALPAATFLPASLWAASQQDNANRKQASTGVYELRIYQAAPGKLGELLTRFREHTTKIFDRHGMKNVAYWTPLDEPQKNDTLIYILQHPSREAAAECYDSDSKKRTDILAALDKARKEIEGQIGSMCK